MRTMIKKHIYGVTLTGVLLAVAVVMSALFMVYRSELSNLKERRLSEIEIRDIGDITYSIEQEEILDDGNYVIGGWLVENGRTYEAYNYGMDATANIAYSNTTICFIDGDNIYELPTKLVQRDDVTELINDSINHKNSGFVAMFNTEKYNYSADMALGAITKDPNGEERLYIIR